MSLTFVKSQTLYELNSQGDEIEIGNELSKWKKEVEHVKIFGLGESNHSVGTTFKAKVSMVKYLHDSLGVDVIAFESGMYDCKKINDSFNDTLNTSSVNFFKGLWGVWRSEEVRELYNYISSKPKQNRPEIIGIDIQLLTHSKEKIAYEYVELSDTLNSYNKNVPVNDTLLFQLLEKAARYSNTYAKLSKSDTTILGEKLRMIESVIESNGLDTTEYFSFFKRMSKNIRVDIIRRYYPKIMMRDSMMYENLLWFVKNNPNKKIAVWAATSHLFYNTDSVGNKDYNFVSMGEHLRKKFGDSYYVIAFTPHSGRGGWKKSGLLSYRIKKPRKKSLEYHINNVSDSDYVLFPLEDNIEWIKKNRITKTKFFWRKEIKMIPYAVSDAAFYIKKMQSPNYIKKNK